MTIRKRILTALMGEMPDQIPFTVYRNMPGLQEQIEQLRPLGLGTMSRIPPWRHDFDEVIMTSETVGDGLDAVRTIRYETPLGILEQVSIREPGYGSWWPQEHFVKSPDDYEILAFIMRDGQIVNTYDSFKAACEEVGETGLVTARAADPPVLELWRRWTGLDRFCYDMHDCPQTVQMCLGAVKERNESIFEVTAGSGAEICSSGGNITADVVSPRLFEEEIRPHYEREAQIMHAAGMRTMNHIDGPVKPLLGSIREAPLDIVEAFAPYPDGDTSVAEAREAWPDKALSINFPSAIHLCEAEDIREHTLQILRQAAPGAGFVVGITENIPKGRPEISLPIIVETLADHGGCPLEA